MKREPTSLRDFFDEIEIPQKLEPENIAKMLKEHQSLSENRNRTVISTQKANITSTSKPKTNSRNIVVSKTRRKNKSNFYARTLATVAACFIVVAGVVVSLNRENEDLIPVGTGSSETTSAKTYKDIYDVIKKEYATDDKNDEDLVEIMDKVEIDEFAVSTDETQKTVSFLNEQYKAACVHTVQDININNVVDQQNDEEKGSELSKVIINNGFVYFISNNALNVVDCTTNEVSLVKKIERENISPIGMFLKDNKLVLISEKVDKYKKYSSPTQEFEFETVPVEKSIESTAESISDVSEEVENVAEDITESVQESDFLEAPPAFEPDVSKESSSEETTVSETTTNTETTEKQSFVDQNVYETYEVESVLIETYDVDVAKNLVYSNKIYQDGKLLKAFMVDGFIYTASFINDADYNVVESENDFVPSYTLNDEKVFVKPENINSSPKLVSTDFVVLTGLDVSSVNPIVSANAMLGFSKGATFSGGNLYLFANDLTAGNQQSYIAKYELYMGDVLAINPINVLGVIKSSSAIDEFEENLRVVTSIFDSENSTFTNTFSIFNDKLEKTGEIVDFGGSKMIKSVKYSENIAYCTADDGSNTILVVDCSDVANPVVLTNDSIKDSIPELYNISSNVYVALGENLDVNGKVNGITVSAFEKDEAKDSYINTANLVLPETFAESEKTPKIYAEVIYSDYISGIVGISVNYFSGIDYANKFYLLSYTPNGEFAQMGMVETNTAQVGYNFKHVYLNENMFYLLSNNRIVCCDTVGLEVLSIDEIKE